MPTQVVDLTDPGFWAGGEVPETIDRMRADAPVARHETASAGPIWSVLSYGHGAAVLSDAKTFSSQNGSLLGSPGVPAGAGKMMALADPPRHRQMRDPVAPFFTHGAVAAHVERIDALTGALIDEALRREVVDFVQDVCSAVPLALMFDLLDLPHEDRGRVRRICDEAFLGDRPERRSRAHQELIPYLFQHALARRAGAGADMVSTLANHPGEQGPLPLEEVVLNLDNILVGGVQTVRHTAGMSALALARHPDAWNSLRAGEVDLGTAVDELLRFTSVGLHVLRTAAHDTELAGQRIRAGDRVVVWVWSANRDPAVFERPHDLLLSRTPNRHLALGRGPHYCIGGLLAKAQLVALLAALVQRVDRLEPVGDPIYNRSIINFGLDAFPVRLVPAPETAAATGKEKS